MVLSSCDFGFGLSGLMMLDRELWFGGRVSVFLWLLYG